MNIKYLYLVTVLAFSTCVCFAKEKYGATVPWTTYEAEHMKTNGTALDPKYGPYQVETESSGQKCVKLNAKGQFVEFTSSVIANSLVIRYSLPDKKEGNGLNATLGIYKNGKLIGHPAIPGFMENILLPIILMQDKQGIFIMK